jgi:hypothetical protein
MAVVALDRSVSTLAVDAVDRDAARGLAAPAGVQILEIADRVGDVWRLKTAKGDIAPHGAALITRLLALSEAGRAALEAWLDRPGRSRTPVVLDLSSLSAEEQARMLESELLGEAQKRAADAEARVGALALALATLRREHESVLDRYQALEAAAVSHDMQPISVPYQQAETLDYVELSADGPLGAIAETIVPAAGAGLFAVELQVGPTASTGALVVEALGRERRQVLHRWRVALDGLEPGAVILKRPVGLVTDQATMALRFSLDGEGSVSLGVGRRHPAQAMGLTGENGQEDARMPALKLYATVPGLHAPQIGADREGETRTLALDAFEQASPDPMDFSDMVVSAPEGGLLLTPVGLQATLALLDWTPDGPETVFVGRAVTAHAESPDIEFALAAGPPAALLEAVAMEDWDGLEMFSGWVRGAAFCPVNVALVCSAPLSGEDRIALIARVSPDADSDWCARPVFRSLRALSV